MLVHRYVDVDDAAVVANLDRPTDLDDYVSQVGTWLEAAG